MGGHIQLGFLYGYTILDTTCISVYIYYIYTYSHISILYVYIYIIMIMIMINYANCSYYLLYFFGGGRDLICVRGT